ncbi:MAG: hypothetical protein M0R06_16285 [Sphaerochaeta sp.]|jgi:hypothetical protein|nr:hypothetical protein [Sphaerochaeta sp.]
MEIRITRVEQIGPTVGVWGEDDKGNPCFTQHINQEPDETGIFSMLLTDLLAPKVKEKPSIPAEKGIEPPMTTPSKIPQEKLNAAKAVVEKYNLLSEQQKRCWFPEGGELIAEDKV